MGNRRTVRRRTYLDTVLQRPQVVGVGLLDNLQFVGALHVLDPFISLTLGVDHQRPPICTRRNQRIMH